MPLALGAGAHLGLRWRCGLRGGAGRRHQRLEQPGVVALLVTLPPLLSGVVRPLGAGRPTVWLELWNWIEALDPVMVFDRFDLQGRYSRRHPDEAFDGLVRFYALYFPLTCLLPVEMVLRFRRIAMSA